MDRSLTKQERKEAFKASLLRFEPIDRNRRITSYEVRQQYIETLSSPSTTNRVREDDLMTGFKSISDELASLELACVLTDTLDDFGDKAWTDDNEDVIPLSPEEELFEAAPLEWLLDSHPDKADQLIALAAKAQKDRLQRLYDQQITLRAQLRQVREEIYQVQEQDPDRGNTGVHDGLYEKTGDEYAPRNWAEKPKPKATPSHTKGWFKPRTIRNVDHYTRALVAQARLKEGKATTVEFPTGEQRIYRRINGKIQEARSPYLDATNNERRRQRLKEKEPNVYAFVTPPTNKPRKPKKELFVAYR